jgi:hypothetical protein
MTEPTPDPDLDALGGPALLEAIEQLTLRKLGISLQDIMSPDLPRLLARYTPEQREMILLLRNTLYGLE